MSKTFLRFWVEMQWETGSLQKMQNGVQWLTKRQNKRLGKEKRGREKQIQRTHVARTHLE